MTVSGWSCTFPANTNEGRVRVHGHPDLDEDDHDWRIEKRHASRKQARASHRQRQRQGSGATRTTRGAGQVGLPVCRRQRGHEGAAGRQGGESCRDDPARSAGAAGFHRYHRGLQHLPRRGRRAARNVGPGARGAGGAGARDRQALRRSRPSAAGVLPFRREVLDARHDGHGAQSRAERQWSSRACRN